MGLLDDLLGQLSGGAGMGRQRPAPPARAGAGIDMQRVMMALLPVVLAMLARRQQSGRRQGELGSRTAPGGMGGGLGDILGGLLGGGGPATSGAGLGGGPGLGNLGSLIEAFSRGGYGQQAQSWVGTGRNQAISPAAVESVFGPGALSEIARQAGLDEQETAHGLAHLLPEVVDHVTPNGSIPEPNALLASVEALARRGNLLGDLDLGEAEGRRG
jgi:uncharacterized protein YidB (DUF937 family)